MERIKYKNYSVNGHDFIVKFTYLPRGSVHNTPIITYQIMKYHELPKTLFELLVEKIKFNFVDIDIWNPEYAEISLEEEVMNKLLKFRDITSPAEIEWEKL